MKNLSQFKSAVPFIIFLILIICFWNAFNKNFRLLPSPLINHPVPAFVADDLFQPNQKITNAIFQGQPTLLNIFASWCSICHSEHPYLMDFHQTSGIRMIGIDYKDDRSNALSWLHDSGNPFDTVIFDPDGALGIDLGVYGTPETFLIDAHGIIRKKIIGAISASQLAQFKQELLSYDAAK